ncbi:Tetracycline resistance protein, class B [Arthrobacter saudimassiliensis]|uniref:Tetracycline resistance protein, class B n=1 Tax=Arthrobacter saudimassiliensis TaxID=1461584 RepID=A0A078MSP6_9MICC|nr:Tetracycline resistance protein, class B [Arthrobacter saudimassiliensis]
MVRASRLLIPREIKVLIAAAFVIALGYGLVAPVLPQFAQSFDVGVTASSVIVSAFAFTRLVFAPAGGQLLEKFGERPVYIWGLLIVALSTAACAFAGTYWQLLLFRGLGGIGSTMFTISAMGLIIRLAPAGVRGRVSGLYASSFLVGNIVGPLVGGLLAGFGMQVPFLVYAVALLIAAGGVAWQLKDAVGPAEGSGTASAGASPVSGQDAADEAVAAAGPVQGEPVTEVAAEAGTAGRAASGSSSGDGRTAGRAGRDTRPRLTVREALQDSAYRAALASSFANGWSSFGVRNSLLPLFAAAVLSGGSETAGIALTFFAGGTALALLFSGRLTDSWGRRPMVLSGLALNAAATAVIGFTDNVPLFLAVSALAGLGTGMLNPAQQAAVADVVGNERNGGKVLAAFQMTADSGAIIGPILAGVLADTLGYEWAFALTGAVALLAFLVWLGARETLAGRPAARTGSTIEE